MIELGSITRRAIVVARPGRKVPWSAGIVAVQVPAVRSSVHAPITPNPKPVTGPRRTRCSVCTSMYARPRSAPQSNRPPTVAVCARTSAAPNQLTEMVGETEAAGAATAAPGREPERGGGGEGGEAGGEHWLSDRVHARSPVGRWRNATR
ncbi:hypothetical protein V2I01_20055 [Micromonospora sp. BRA006-A]|nr:hypothetical protein [Micromonospora sp. BRA006-A]